MSPTDTDVEFDLKYGTLPSSGMALYSFASFTRPFDSRACAVPGTRGGASRHHARRGDEEAHRHGQEPPAPALRTRQRASSAPLLIASPLAISSGVPGPVELVISACATSCSIAPWPRVSISTALET
jgi:hypothetical protein